MKLQRTSVDIVEAFSMVDEVKNIYKELHETIEDDFNQIYEQAIRMASQVNVQPTSQPLTAGRQKQRENLPAKTVKDYYRRIMAIPFLDHVILDFEFRISPLSITASRLLGLIPSIQCNSDVTVDVSEADLKHWKLRWQNKPSEERPTSCVVAIKECDVLSYPNVFKLLKIACTLPVTSCECSQHSLETEHIHA